MIRILLLLSTLSVLSAYGDSPCTTDYDDNLQRILECVGHRAEQGVAEEQYKLGIPYAKGEGVVKNKYEAYIWFSIAKAKDIEQAADAIRDLSLWNLYLTVAEIRAAKREAERRFEAIENRKN